MNKRYIVMTLLLIIAFSYAMMRCLTLQTYEDDKIVSESVIYEDSFSLEQDEIAVTTDEPISTNKDVTITEAVLISDSKSNSIFVDKSEEKLEYHSTYLSSCGFKSFMPYNTITSKSSNQYKIQNIATTDKETGIRIVNERYCVAIGTGANAKVGQYCDLVLENDQIIPCVVADIKKDKDTASDNLTSQNGCVSEFLVDYDYLPSIVLKMGDCSYCKEEWNSPVCEIRVYETSVLE